MASARLLAVAVAVVLAVLVAATLFSRTGSGGVPVATPSSSVVQGEETCSSSGGGGVEACLPESGAAPLPLNESSSVYGGASGSGSVYLVEFGVLSCPHCRAMKEFLPKLGLPSFFCPLSRKECAEAFKALMDRGVPGYVPVIVACSGKGVLLVEVGEHRDKDWWLDKLAGLQPVENGEVALYIGGKEKGGVRIDPDIYSLVCRVSLGAAERLEGD